MADEERSAIEQPPVAAYFSRLADSYGDGEYYGRRRAAGIVAISPEIVRARTILDLGCGNGAYLQDLVRVGKDAKVTGADLTIDMLSAARRRVGDRANFVKADATALPFKDRSWDLIFCSHVLQFVTDLPGCISGIARCLCAGGAFVTSLEDGALQKTLAAIMAPDELARSIASISRAARARRRNRPGDDVYLGAFASAGLVAEMRTAPFSVTGLDIEEWLRVRWMPVTSESGRAEMEQMLARFRDDKRVAELKLDYTERLLVGRKPA